MLLEGADAHHLIKVRRKTKGDRVYGKTFDRRELTMQIEAIKTSPTPGQVHLKVLSQASLTVRHKQHIFCFISIPKLKTLASLLPKLSELDSRGCIPVITERSFVQKESQWKSKRFERIVMESFKQCGRDAPLKLYPPRRIEDIASIEKEIGSFREMDLFVPWEGESQKHLLHSKIGANTLGYFIGPEGGLTQAEVKLLKGFGFKSVSLGETVLKVENAAIATLIYLRALGFFENP